MNFSYTDISFGNATCTFEINGKKYQFYPSFEEDALGELVTQLAAIQSFMQA